MKEKKRVGQPYQCPYCYEYFIAKQKNQVTCGKKECVRMRRAENWKKWARKNIF